jgi:methylase of polypeptide subunit release factors
MARSRPCPLAVDDPGAVAELRSVLFEAGFDAAAVRAVLDPVGTTLLRADEKPVQVRRLAPLGKFGTLTGLLVLGIPQSAGDVRSAFAPLRLEQLEAMGLVETGDGRVRCPVRVVPHDDLVIASDPGGPDQPADFVAGIHNASTTLAQLTVRRPVNSALDVGTGTGVQAILASRHAHRVVATDVNERALGFAAFNAVLNGAVGIELRAGSFFDPVAGELFGLAVSNPPFVVSPDMDFLFRDSELPGDAVSEHVVRGVPATLEEGGFATVMISWARSAEDDWPSRLLGWLAGLGCDALLLHYGTRSPLTHAADWTLEHYGSRPAQLDAALDRWLAYLEEHEIGGVGYGAVVLRRREAESHWVRAHDILMQGVKPAGDHILRIFQAQDHLAALAEDDGILDDRLVVAPGVEVRQQVALREGGWTVEVCDVTAEEGLGFRADVDPLTARLLAALDRRRTLGEAVGELAGEDEDRDELARAAVPVARTLFELGLLELAT